MRLSKLPWLLLLLLVAVSAVHAQQPPYLRCSNVSESTVDSVTIVDIASKPGDTVFVPIHVGTAAEISGFKMLIRYDTTLLTFVPDPDPANTDGSYVLHTLAGRMQDVQNTLNSQYPSLVGTPSEVRAMQVQESFNPFDSGALIAQYFYIPPDSAIPYVNLAAGEGVIFKLAFTLDANAQQDDQAALWWYEVNESYIDPGSGLLVYTDCRRTDMADAKDTSATLFPKTVGQDGFVVADTAPAPQIVNFTADSYSLSGTTTQTILRWEVNTVDSMTITGRNLNFSTTTLFSDQTFVQPGALGDWDYVLKAFNSSDSTFDTLTITVTDGGGGGGGTNTLPVVQPIVPNSISVEPGQTVGFSVTATDAEGGTVTLTATGLPAGATFGTSGQVVGTTPVTGNFSWTPGQSTAGNSYVVSFSATDDSGAVSSAVTASINVQSIQGDYLFTTSSTGQNPVGGLRGRKNVFFPIDLVTTQTVYGVQFNLQYNSSFFDLDSVVTTDRTVQFDVYDDIGPTTAGNVKVVTFSTANDTILTGDTSTAILYAVFSIDSNAVPGDYPVYLVDGRESNTPDPSAPSLELVTDTGIIQVDTPGDVNLDRSIDVGDLVNIVAYIIGNFGLPDRQFEVADVIFNDTVNVNDLVGVINLVFGLPVSPSGPVTTQIPQFAKVTFDYNDMYSGTSDYMTVKSELPTDVAGIELEIQYDASAITFGKPTLKPAASGMNFTYKDNGNGTMHLLMNFSNPYRTQDLVRAGLADLVDIPMSALQDLQSTDDTKIRLHKAYISTPTTASVPVDGIDPNLPISFELYQNYPNPFNPTTTISFTIGLSGTPQVKLDVYNILGQRVTTLLDKKMVAGSHSIEWDGTNRDGQRVASGIYLYKLQVNDNSETRKMLLLK
jgi:hypothetical protein